MASYTMKNHVGDRWVQKTQDGILVWDIWPSQTEKAFEVEAEADALTARDPVEFEEII